MALTERVDAALIDQLLYGSEGVDLDFKRDQYPFKGATDLEKAELLKDILAFANAFRRNTAFILVGVEEVPCGRAKVVGVLEQLKDADLQQFVNAKTNRNVIFSYHALEFEGKQIGVIRIQEQQRPIFLKNDFGYDPARERHKLKANAVYFRVGSSTKEASPEDIARMGSQGARPVYDVDLQFANFGEKTAAGTVLQTSHDFLIFEGKICDYVRRQHSIPHLGIEITGNFRNFDNRHFWREAYNYILHWNALAEVGFCIENRGEATIDDVTVEISVEADTGFIFVTEDGMPERPKAEADLYYEAQPNFVAHNPNIRVERQGDQQVLTLRFGKVQAGQRRYLPEPLYIGNAGEKSLTVEAVVTADQFPAPLVARMEFHARGTLRKVGWGELKSSIEEKFFGADRALPENCVILPHCLKNRNLAQKMV